MPVTAVNILQNEYLIDLELNRALGSVDRLDFCDLFLHFVS
jgi:hypothetical protein